MLIATKTITVTENELKQLIIWHGYNLNDEGKMMPIDGDMFDRIERINYLNKRLKAFKEPEITEQVKSDNSAAGWGSNNAQS